MPKNLSLSIILMTGLLVSACNFPLFAQPTEAPNQLATSVAQTIEAMVSQPLATEQPPAQQPTMPAGLPTVTPPAPTAVFTVQTPPTATPQPCNKAEFLSETIPDGTQLASGEAFSKTWTFKNAGTCTWNTNYKLVFASGEAMGGPASVKFAKTVAPGEQITVAVPLTAPTTAGTYLATWKLQADDGSQFGQVTVSIKVVAAAFAVSSVFTNLKNVSPGTCPYTFAIEISIEASAAGKVIYQTENSDGITSGLQTLKFDDAGTKVVKQDWAGLGVGGTTTPYWLKVFIQSPNNQTFGPFNFKVKCP
jgi:hypothetical protein